MRVLYQFYLTMYVCVHLSGNVVVFVQGGMLLHILICEIVGGWFYAACIFI